MSDQLNYVSVVDPLITNHSVSSIRKFPEFSLRRSCVMCNELRNSLKVIIGSNSADLILFVISSTAAMGYLN